MQEFLHAFSKVEFNNVKARVVEYASSSTAKKLIDALVPSTSQTDIQYELDIVSEMKQVIQVEGGISNQFGDDIHLLLHKLGIDGAFLYAHEFLQLQSLLKVSREVATFFSRRGKDYLLISQKCTFLYFDKVIEFNIEHAIDENGTVKDSASKRLREIRRSISDQAIVLRKRLDSILKKVVDDGFAQDEIITTREGRMVLPIKSEFKNNVEGFIHSSSQSGQTVFIEPSETLQMNNEIRSLHFEEQREIEKILRDLSKQVSEHRVDLLQNVEILHALEVVEAKARYSIEVNGASPKIVETGSMYLENARHPLLLNKHTWDEVVPLTIEMGKDWKTLLITGPNAGGKSVALKTIGLLITMVQAGFHIPVSPESRCRIVQKLFVDIGDNQSIENDLSTFSSHLHNLKTVIENVDEESLVLLDELGSGTDPSEGSAIAASVLEFLTKKQCLTIATTHNGELKAFAQNTEGIENAGMEFDQDTLMPTYRLRVGIPGSSYALEIAQRMNFPEYVLAEAKKYRGELPNYLEQLLIDVEKRSHYLNTELAHIAEEREKVSAMVITYEAKLDTLKKESKELRKKAINEADEILANARRTIEFTVREIKESSAAKNVVTERIEEVEALKKKIQDQKKELQTTEELKQQEFRPGDFVRRKGSTEMGEIVSEVNNKDEFWVAFATLKMKVARSELQRVEAKQVKRLTAKTSAPDNTKERRREIDLRGLYGDEAVALVDKFLDEASMSGYDKVFLIHGKGTGALRSRIKEYLSSHPLAKSHAFAEWNEGGLGVTVVELQR